MAQLRSYQLDQLGLADEYAILATLVHGVGHRRQQLALRIQAHRQISLAAILHALLIRTIGFAASAAQQHLDTLLVQRGAVFRQHVVVMKYHRHHVSNSGLVARSRTRAFCSSVCHSAPL